MPKKLNFKPNSNFFFSFRNIIFPREQLTKYISYARDYIYPKLS